MEHADLAQAAAVCGALGSALVLLARGRLVAARRPVALALAEAGLVGALDDGGLDKLTSAAGGAAAVAGHRASWAAPRRCSPAGPRSCRWPCWWPRPSARRSPSTARTASSSRWPRTAGSGRLLPLYFVLAAAGLALGWRALRGAASAALPRALALPAAAFFAFAFLSLLWADDIEAGANLLAFFTLPFAALLAVVAPRRVPRLGAARARPSRRSRWRRCSPRSGIWQAVTHELFFYAPNLAVSNANTDFFRVTSLFGDPSLYGRHVVLGIGVVLALLATSRSRNGLAARRRSC